MELPLSPRTGVWQVHNTQRTTTKKAPIFIRALFLVVVISIGSRPALGWGPEGHDVIVRMALRRMKPAERKAVYALLGTTDTYFIANWADKIKDKNGTGAWHFVDIPGRNKHYNAERDCPDGNCIIAKLAMVQSTIRNHSASRQARRKALLYWFHLVGDLYQPFHCYGDKAGGNGVAVYFKGKRTNLHRLWDSKIISYENHSARELASDIFDASHRVPSATLTFVDVAERSHARAVSKRLKNNTTVTASYLQQSWAMIQVCLWDAACMASTIGPDV